MYYTKSEAIKKQKTIMKNQIQLYQNTLNCIREIEKSGLDIPFTVHGTHLIVMVYDDFKETNRLRARIAKAIPGWSNELKSIFPSSEGLCAAYGKESEGIVLFSQYSEGNLPKEYLSENCSVQKIDTAEYRVVCKK